ncbi:MAG: prenyltransferase/squalene oxidase repeat-containing protein [Planctomycetota bacterium]|jgi:hypothetical protein
MVAPPAPRVTGRWLRLALALLVACRLTIPAEAQPADVAPPAPEAVDAAIEKGVAWVVAAQDAKGAWGSGSRTLGHTALAVFALLHAGLDEGGSTREDKALRRALRLLDRIGPGREGARDRETGTYASSLLLLLLDARARPEDRPRMQRLVELLERSQAENGQWSYEAKPANRRHAAGDNSNAQFAVLALGTAVGRGLDVRRDTLERAHAWWLGAAQSDGGYGYSSGGSRASTSVGSMTAAGVCSLAILDAARGEGRASATQEMAIRRLARDFRIDKNFGPAQGGAGQRQRNAGRGWLHYYLWSVERALVLAGRERIADRDWYAEGAAHLLDTQYDDGSWRGEHPLYATCFALLFLTRAAAPPRAFTPPPRVLDGAVTPGEGDPEGTLPTEAPAMPDGTVAEWLRADLPPHPLNRNRLALWIRQNLRFLVAEDGRFVVPE